VRNGEFGAVSFPVATISYTGFCAWSRSKAARGLRGLSPPRSPLEARGTGKAVLPTRVRGQPKESNRPDYSPSSSPAQAARVLKSKPRGP